MFIFPTVSHLRLAARLRNQLLGVSIIASAALVAFSEYNYGSKYEIPEAPRSRQRVFENHQASALVDVDAEKSFSSKSGYSASRKLVHVDLLRESVAESVIPVSERCLEFRNGNFVTTDESVRAFVFPETYGDPATNGEKMTFEVRDCSWRLLGQKYTSPVRGLPVPLPTSGFACVVTKNQVFLLCNLPDHHGFESVKSIPRLDQTGKTRCVSSSQVYYLSNELLLLYCGEQPDLGMGDSGSIAELYRISDGNISPITTWTTYPSFNSPQLHVSGEYVYSISSDGRKLDRRNFSVGMQIDSLELPIPMDNAMDYSSYRFSSGNYISLLDASLRPRDAFDIHTLRKLPMQRRTERGTTADLLYFDNTRDLAWYGEDNTVFCFDLASGNVIHSEALSIPIGNVEGMRNKKGFVIHSRKQDLKWAEIHTDGTSSINVQDGLLNHRRTHYDIWIRVFAWGALLSIGLSCLVSMVLLQMRGRWNR